jgi:hypothetical protein
VSELSQMAKLDSAIAILAQCQAIVSRAITTEETQSMVDRERLSGLKSVAKQLREERQATLCGDVLVTTKIRLLYGLLLQKNTLSSESSTSVND